jgi:hypothetical protein
MMDTCAQVLRRCVSKICAITLAISAVLHKAKTRESGITILQPPDLLSIDTESIARYIICYL